MSAVDRVKMDAKVCGGFTPLNSPEDPKAASTHEVTCLDARVYVMLWVPREFLLLLNWKTNEDGLVVSTATTHSRPW